MDKDEKDMINPIRFTDEKTLNAMTLLSDAVNTPTKFAILKTTENGRWMRGDLLYYRLNGVEVYTQSNNIIFVDLENNLLFIKEYSKVMNEIAPVDPEQKQYYILYTDLGYEDGEEQFPLRWEACHGRTNAYEAIKANANVIDVDKSIVIVESVAIKDCLTVREFVNYVQNADMVDKSDGFSMDDYENSEYI